MLMQLPLHWNLGATDPATHPAQWMDFFLSGSSSTPAVATLLVKIGPTREHITEIRKSNTFGLKPNTGPCSYSSRIFCQVWCHTSGDVTHRIPAKYFAEHFSRIFCTWQMCHMWPSITLVCTFHSVKYCLIDNFQCLFLHIPSVLTTFNLPTSPEITLAAPDWPTKWPTSQKSIMPLSGRIFCRLRHTVWCQGQWRPLCGLNTLSAHASWSMIPEYLQVQTGLRIT